MEMVQCRLVPEDGIQSAQLPKKSDQWVKMEDVGVH
jgi:hypothetical protein